MQVSRCTEFGCSEGDNPPPLKSERLSTKQIEGMTLDEYEKLPSNEKEHFYQCSECGQFVDKRELHDVIFHTTDHKPNHHISRIIGKPITKRFPTARNRARIVFDCWTANDAARMYNT
jgi:hypothetical protein